MPVVTRGQVAVGDDLVMDQILGMFWRALGAEVSGRGADNKPRGGETTADQGGISQAGNSDRQIKAFLNNIHNAVGQVDVEFHIRIFTMKLPPQGRQVANAKTHRGIDAQHSLGDAAA